MQVSRRTALSTGAAIAGIACSQRATSARSNTAEAAQDESLYPLDDWFMQYSKTPPPTKDLGAPLIVKRFKDAYYVVAAGGAWWKAGKGQRNFAKVEVPIGFVTDFASIPRVFWSLFRPDGVYMYAAVIHDFLYWDQQRDRTEADQVFRYAMQDLRISEWQSTVLFRAVDTFGRAAWESNRSLKASGECRILSPDAAFKPDTTWDEWKKVNRGVCR